VPIRGGASIRFAGSGFFLNGTMVERLGWIVKQLIRKAV
jgi:hypothetical protein